MLSESDIQKKLSEMTLEQKLGHVVVARGGDIASFGKEYFLDLVKRGCVGGVQPPRDDAAPEFIAEVKALAPNNILFCNDMEHGAPIPGSHKLPSMISLSSAGSEELAYEFGRITAVEAKAVGYSLAWGPVVDLIGPNGYGPLRKLSDDPYYTAKVAENVAKGYMSEGLFCTAKHFPGGCDVDLDTHMFPDAKSMRTEEELMEKDLVPYIEMLKNSTLQGIMTSHKKFPNIDPVYPASLSEKIISIIRKQGFDGLIVTDSLAMMGVLDEFGDEGSLGLAIKAGNDMVLPNYRITHQEVMTYMRSAYDKGVITPERLDDAVRRVLIAQDFASQAAKHTSISEEQIKCIEKLEKECICAKLDDGVSPCIDKDKSHLFVVLKENLYPDDNGVAHEYAPLSAWKPDEIEKMILERFPGSEVRQMYEFPTNSEIQQLCYASTFRDDIIFVTFCKNIAYGGSDSFTEKIISTMTALQRKISAIVHVGNPTALEKAPHSPRVVWGTVGKNSAKYALDVLAGKMEAKGKFAVSLNLK